MQRKFIGNLGLLLFLNLLVKPFWVFGIDRTVQNTVGAEEYGVYYALLNFSFLLNMLLDVGITNFNTRNIAQHQQLIKKHFSGITALRFLLAGGYMVVTLLSGLIIGYSEKQLYLLLLLGFNQCILSFILYMRSNLAGLHIFRSYSFISVLDRVILIGICSVLLWGNFTNQAFKIEWFVYAQTAAYLLTGIVAFFMVLNNTKLFRLNWNLPFFLVILKRSFPFALLILLMTFYNRIDTVMLERMLPNGAQQAGIYAQGYRVLDAINMIAYLFAGLLLPIFARMIKLKEKIEDLVAISFRLLVGGAIVLGVASYCYSQPIMELMYHEHISISAPVFGWLMLCFVPVATTYVFGTLLTANGNLKALNLMAFGGMLLNIGLNLWLIPKYFALGSAWASFSTQIITALVQFCIAQYIFRFKVNGRFIASTLLFLAGILIAAWGSKSLQFNWKYNLLILIILSTFWMVISGFLNVKHIYRIIRYGD